MIRLFGKAALVWALLAVPIALVSAQEPTTPPAEPPATSEPAATEPATTEPAKTEPAASEAPAAEPAPSGPDATITEEAPPPPVDAGNNAWMLTSSALVLMMTGPGLALFYCGLVRKKNVLSVMMQCVSLMCLMTVIWALYGYSLAFGGDVDAENNKKSIFVGDGSYVFMQGVQTEYDESAGAIKVPMFTLTNIPLLTHMLFQGMFFVITPALICGAFAERMKFSTMVVFMILWGTIVYCPLAHMVWDSGLLAFNTPASSTFAVKTGALDFAGGTVVHISSGVSALICALVLGPRLGFRSDPMPPHNLTYTVMGATLLWVGWFGFNAGSELASDGVAASAFAATHFAAAAGGLAWPAIEWITRGKPTVLGACSGIVAGLVCITPASGYVTPMPALVMGVAAGVVCYFACTTIKSKFGYDDSLDAFGVHGVGGTLGAILTGVFATKAVYIAKDGDKVLPLGLIDGDSTLFMGQIAAVIISWGLAIVATFVILKVLDAVMGLRVSQQDEITGLDQSQHGEEGYIFL